MTGRPPSAREERLKAALRDNLRRRKVQARELAEPSDGARDDSGRSDGALARSDDTERGIGMTQGGTEAELAAKRAEIAALIARELGFGDLAALDAEQRRIVAAATDSTIERSVAVVPDHADPIIANARLGRLLAEHRSLEQLRVDERETLLAGEGGGREDDA